MRWMRGYHGTLARYTAGCRCEDCTAKVTTWRSLGSPVRLPPSWVAIEQQAHAAVDREGRVHGTPSAYSNGCRCEQCRQAWADYQRKRRQSMRQEPTGDREHVHREGPVHGTPSAYSNGCRCEQCRQAWADYQRKRRQSMRQEPTGDREHVQELAGAVRTRGRRGTQREPIPDDVWLAVIQRDHGLCRYCGRPARPLHLDHVVPLAKGGTTVIENLVLACRSCNLRKGTRLWVPSALGTVS